LNVMFDTVSGKFEKGPYFPKDESRISWETKTREFFDTKLNAYMTKTSYVLNRPQARIRWKVSARQLFEWGRREGMKDALLNRSDDFLAALQVGESFERQAQLRHFLHRCVTRGDLSDNEMDLLVQFKLEGDNEADSENSNGSLPNAIRQRLKRVVAKLRRLAR
jgi:hypothetical protein